MIYKRKLINIKNFIFDVDGVFTDGSIIVDSAGNLTSETILVSTSNVEGAITLPQNQTIQSPSIAISGNDLYYQTYHGVTGVRFFYKQDITDIQTTSDLLDSGSDLSFDYLFVCNFFL